MSKEKECPCPKKECQNHGDCVACFTNHKSKELASFCKRPGAVIPPGLAERVRARLEAAGAE